MKIIEDDEVPCMICYLLVKEYRGHGFSHALNRNDDYMTRVCCSAIELGSGITLLIKTVVLDYQEAYLWNLR